MCTVVFIPNKNTIYLGSLRDESPKRKSALLPQIYSSAHTTYLAPKDTVANGTWIGVNNLGNVIVLLNGGFENHQPKSYYRKSRGLIVTELLLAEMPVVEWSLIDLQDIEPFTIIVCCQNKLFELVWDGNEKHGSRLDAKQFHIWSSSTLYNAEVKKVRKELFQNWISISPNISKHSLLNFFRSFPNTQNGFVMNRNDITKTLSYSVIEMYPQHKAVFNYYDFVDNSYHSKTIILKNLNDECMIKDISRRNNYYEK